MEKIIHIVIAGVLVFSIAGCRYRSASRLDMVECAIDSNTDSAYSMLLGMQEEAKDYNKRNRNRYELLKLKCQNILDLPFDSQDSIQAVADFYATHGSYNEALLSAYLLGRSFMVNGDEPMAVECFSKCLALRIPNNQYIDYIQLSKVHSQLCNIYRDEKLYDFLLKELNLAREYAYAGGDSLLALMYEYMKVDPYNYWGKTDSVIAISTRLYDKYISMGMRDRAAESLYMVIVVYADKKEYAKAKYYMDIFERESRAFDSIGNIEPGREIFYYLKGRVYEGLGQLDSAEYQYRRLLAYRQDNNNIEGATKGLLSIYRKRKNTDSIGKYADWYCEANDSAHAQLVSEDVARLKAMYDYSEYKRKSEEMRVQAEETRRNIIIAVSAIALLLCFSVYRVYLFRKRKQAEAERLLEEYDRTLQIIEDLNGDKEEMLRRHQDELERITDRLKAKGVSLTNEGYDICINDELRKKFDNCAEFMLNRSEDVTAEDWHNLFVDMSHCDKRFMLLLRESSLTENEKKIAVLTRLRFKDYQIKNIMRMQGNSLSNHKARINSKLFKENGAKTLRRQVYAVNAFNL